MPPYEYDEHGRRIAAQPKGERRERVILDEAEQQLRDAGPDGVTMGSIASAAGVTRAALYFYFRSKNDVLAALVQRVVSELSSAVASSDAVAGTSAAEAISGSIARTADLWRRHGAVMQAAVELAPSVMSVGDLWSGARAAIELSASRIVEAGPSQLTDAGEISSVVHVLVGMTERAFYDASKASHSLESVSATTTLIWRRALLLH